MLSETQVAKLFIKALNPEERKLAHFSHMAPVAFEVAAMRSPIAAREFEDYAAGKLLGIKLTDLKGKAKLIAQKKYLFLEFMRIDRCHPARGIPAEN